MSQRTQFSLGILGLTILSDVSTILFDILELTQGLDDVDVLPCPCDNEF